MHLKRFLMIALAGAMTTVAASAGTIGPACGSCFGGTYSLDGHMVSSGGGTELWQFTYTLMTQNVIENNVSYVGSIAAKVTSGLVSASTVNNPTGGSWTAPAINSNLDSSGCSGHGNGWVCIAWNSGAQLLTGPSAAASYSWVFDVRVNSGTILSTYSIQANFDPATGKLLSEDITVPEGTHFELPILLCGLGLWMLIQARRKRFQAAN